ncbi:hypothetical protein [Streptomyces sp. NPDC056194]|uniref:hypothetical protein n=1 Tax=unclassified Streptomyces TaxID=2593676 RepID=UPI0035DEEFB5
MPYGGAAAGPTCPGPVAAGTNAVLNSSHWYELVNDTHEDILVDILMELSDSDGNNASESHSNEIVPAQSDITVNSALSIVALYPSPGPVSVTASTTITGAVSTSGSNSCTFSVTADAPFEQQHRPAPGRRLFRSAQRRSSGAKAGRRLLHRSRHQLDL